MATTPTTPVRTRTRRTPEPEPEPNRTGPFGLMMMVLFWLMVLKYGYTALTLVYIALIVGMFALTSSITKDEDESVGHEFLQKLENNDWVFRACFLMVVFSGVMWYFTPGVTLNPVKYAWQELKDAVSMAPTDPWANDGPWNGLRHFLVGDDGWGQVAISYIWWSIVAIPISFTDEVFNVLKGVWKEKKEGGMAKFILKDGIAGVFWKLIGIPFKR